MLLQAAPVRLLLLLEQASCTNLHLTISSSSHVDLRTLTVKLLARSILLTSSKQKTTETWKYTKNLDELLARTHSELSILKETCNCKTKVQRLKEEKQE